ncbi:hypothetical protein L1887_34701 [Cichorium endivia]|nr:hypothetical protein L1887_34701 [Cichorium endivia]
MIARNANEVDLVTVMVELLAAVVSETKRTAKFRTPLKRLETTLRNIELIFYRYESHFWGQHFYVIVSHITSLKTIVHKLFAHLNVKCCGLQTDEEAKNQLENFMRQMGLKNMLLVPDDVWSESESLIQDLKFTIPGYKILVTSRFLFSRFGSTYELTLLNDQDAKTTFCSYAFYNMNLVNVPDDLVNKILWVSDNGILDLGGDNEEETCYSDEVNQHVLTYPDSSSGCQCSVKSNQINEMEGGTLFEFDHDLTSGSHLPNEQLGLDDATSCAPAFRVLKQIIQRCLADVVSSGNIFADAMLQHLYRWLCSPRSKLHDPALHRMLHRVMQKVFALLLDLFEWIELEPMQFWHSLQFMDQANLDT